MNNQLEEVSGIQTGMLGTLSVPGPAKRVERMVIDYLCLLQLQHFNFTCYILGFQLEFHSSIVSQL
jgi:hypothetical protein